MNKKITNLGEVEIWKEIHNHNTFMVSDAGRIKEVLDDTETIVKEQQDKEGQVFVMLDGKRHYVGYTVLKTFVGEMPNKYNTQIRHSMTKGLVTKYSRFDITHSNNFKVNIFGVASSEIYFEDGYGYLIKEDISQLLTMIEADGITAEIERSYQGMILSDGELDIFEHNEIVFKFELGLTLQELLMELQDRKMMKKVI